MPRRRRSGCRSIDTLQVLSWREVDFAGVVLAGLVAGYVMALAGLWAGAIPGLTSIDVADYGRRYMISDRSSAWLLGLASHLANSVILVLFWASVVVPNVAWPRPLTGFLWGIVLAFTLAGALVSPLSGLGFLGWKMASRRFATTSILMHAIWGVSVGLLYVPR